MIIGMGDNGQKQIGSVVIRGVGKKYGLTITLNQKQWNKYVMSILLNLLKPSGFFTYHQV